ncbi:hypothetical protein CC86DRAFT_52666 [Ophiobolus disseminans]|uniref:Uncharacterized protein n=1 Tax=Ophiobolus disseminans TaxID=1469910 RepID=A0A6A6ZTU5_9PLEO|nr:hypothetical protein CC86DRAFT_52666 [Ophiobolus disseminans]
MAWCAIGLKAPAWLTRSCVSEPDSELEHTELGQDSGGMYLPRFPHRPADIYTVRVFDASMQPNLFRRLRNTVVESGGTMIVELVEGRGFIFSMPNSAPNPLTSYQQGSAMEEGRIQVTKTTLEKEETSSRSGSVGSIEGEDEVETEEHPNLKMQWTWTDTKR